MMAGSCTYRRQFLRILNQNRPFEKKIITKIKIVKTWRPGSESNRRSGICSPVHYHFATRPHQECKNMQKATYTIYTYSMQQKSVKDIHIER